MRWTFIGNLEGICYWMCFQYRTCQDLWQWWWEKPDWEKINRTCLLFSSTKCLYMKAWWAVQVVRVVIFLLLLSYSHLVATISFMSSMLARILQGANCFTMNNPMFILNLHPIKNPVRLGEMLHMIITKEFLGLRDLLNYSIQDIFYNSANCWLPPKYQYDSCQDLRITITDWEIGHSSNIPQ